MEINTPLEVLLKRKKFRAESVVKKIKWDRAALLDISKKQVIEMRKLMWATPKNLTDWSGEWENFVLTQGFALHERIITGIFSCTFWHKET